MRDNLGYKLLAIVMAVLLWVKVSADRNPAGTRVLESVQVQYSSLQKGYMMTGAPSTISLNMSGPQSALRLLDPRKIRASIDLSDAEPGVQHVRPVIKLPADLEGKVTPAPQDVQVKIEVFKQKSHRVDVTFEGAPPLGKAFGKADADPPVAVVSGRSSLVDQVRRLVVTVNAGAVESEDNDYYVVTPVNDAGSEIRGLKIEPSQVSVSLQLVDAPATKNVIVSPSIVGQPSYPLKVASVTVSPQAITVFGPPNSVARMSTIATEEIDISDALESVTSVVSLKTPSDIRTGGVRTVRVTVKITQ